MWMARTCCFEAYVLCDAMQSIKVAMRCRNFHSEAFRNNLAISEDPRANSTGYPCSPSPLGCASVLRFAWSNSFWCKIVISRRTMSTFPAYAAWWSGVKYQFCVGCVLNRSAPRFTTAWNFFSSDALSGLLCLRETNKNFQGTSIILQKILKCSLSKHITAWKQQHDFL